jgi:hypothetical protein
MPLQRRRRPDRPIHSPGQPGGAPPFITARRVVVALSMAALAGAALVTVWLSPGPDAHE